MSVFSPVRALIDAFHTHIHSVLGPVAPEELGAILPHEHLLVDMRSILKPADYTKQLLTELDLVMHNLGKIRQYP